MSQMWQAPLAVSDRGAGAQFARQRIAMRIRRTARLVAAPALVAMVGGLVLFAVTTAPLPHGKGATSYVIASTPTIALADLLDPTDRGAPNWWMSIGILALIGLPAINVGIILWENVKLHRWTDALAAAGVLAILAAGALLTRR